MAAYTNDQTSAKARSLRLVTLRRMAGLSMRILCEQYDIGYSTLRQWEHARVSGLSKKGAKRIIEAMLQEGVRCNLSWLLYGIGEPPSYMKKTRIAEPPPEAFSLSKAAITEELAVKQEMEYFQHLHRDGITFQIQDDAMEPLLKINDYVGGICREKKEIKQVLNQDCIVETADYQLLCRRFAPGSKENLFNLYCINPNSHVIPLIQTDMHILRAAPITRLWRKYTRHE